MSDSESYLSEDESSKITQDQINQLTNTLINAKAEKGKTRSQKSAHKQKSGFDALMALTLKVSGQNDKIMKKMEKMEKFISSVTPKLQCRKTRFMICKMKTNLSKLLIRTCGKELTLSRFSKTKWNKGS